MREEKKSSEWLKLLCLPMISFTANLMKSITCF